MRRRDLLRTLATISATNALGNTVAHASSTPLRRPRTRQPNILVFLSDDHAQWLQQAYGNSEVHTPNMSRIARLGVRMENAFTTCPVCSPARASFFTGRMPSQHGIHDWIEEKTRAYSSPWLKGQTLISELLRAAGYHTGLVGKWHCGFEREPRPGFDFWFSYWESQYPHAGAQHFSDNGKLITVDGFQSPRLTDQALRFLRSHYSTALTRTKPFFLFVGYTDTHSPHTQMPEEFVSRYKSASFRDIPQEIFSAAHGKPLIPVSNEASAEHDKREQYYAAATSIDREVGRVLDELESMGQLEDTLVVYTGDHGLNAGHHGMWEKGNATLPQNFLEESIRVPCTLSWPNGGVAKDLTSALAVNHCDLFATLLEAADASPANEAGRKINSPGRSYLAQLRGKDSPAHDDTVFCEYGNARMIRSDSYKLILRYPFRDVRFANEFYDLKSDPRETRNLYEKPEFTKRIEAMTSRLDRFYATYTVPGHEGIHLENQPLTTPASPWLQAAKS